MDSILPSEYLAALRGLDCCTVSNALETFDVHLRNEGFTDARILRALGGVGVVTNGAVRDLPAIEAAQFSLFAGNVAISPAYAHFIDFRTPIFIAGLKISPASCCTETVAVRLKEKEQNVITRCHSPDFSLEKLREAVAEYRTK